MNTKLNIKSKYLRNILAVVMVFAVAALMATAYTAKTSAVPIECDPSPCPSSPTSPTAPAASTDASAKLRADAECAGDASLCVCPKDNPAACADPALKDCTEQDCNIVKKYLNPFINLLTIVVGIGVTIGIIIGGIKYSASAGDPQKAADGKKHIRNAIVALVAYIFLYAFIQFLTPGNGLFKT